MNTQTKIKVGVVAGALLAFACMQSVRAQSIVDVARSMAVSNELKAMPECNVAVGVAIKSAQYRLAGLTKSEVDTRVDTKIEQPSRVVAHRVVNRVYSLPELQLQHSNEVDFASLGVDVCKFHKESGV